MIITKHNRDINLFVLQIGATLGVSFAGFLFSRLRNHTRRTRPALPPLRLQSSDHGYRDCSNRFNDRGEADTQKTSEETDLDERDVFLLPEFEEEVEKLDMLVCDDCETPRSDITVPLAFPSEEEAGYENEIKHLRNTVRALHERERCLEDKLLEYYSLKEQQKIAMELRSRLKLNQIETKAINLQIKSLQGENEKLKAQCSEHLNVVLELDKAKSEVQVLKKKLNINTQQHVAQILSLKKRVASLQEEEIRANLPDPEAYKMMQRLRDLEGEINDLRDSNMRLHSENVELSEKLEFVQIIANSTLEDPKEIKTLQEDGNRLRSENEELKKEIEQLQGDRCNDLEELVYLRWINACLRYELRTYQPPAGKTVARDLSTTLSPNSEEKAKQLILEYAQSEGHGEDNTDYDRWSSSQEESSMITESIMFLDDSSIDTSFVKKTKKSGKKNKKLMDRLAMIFYGKDTQERKKRGGSSEASSSSTGVHSTPRQLRSTHSMDFQTLMHGKEEEDEFNDHIRMMRGKSKVADCPIYEEEHSLESDQIRLTKFADALTKSRSTTYLHKKSVSFDL